MEPSIKIGNKKIKETAPLTHIEKIITPHSTTTHDSAQIEASLRATESKYQLLISSMDQGFCIIEMIFDEKKLPIDFRYLEINSAFEKQTGLTNIIGKTIKEIMPEVAREGIEICGSVALTGKAANFETYVKELNRWFETYALRENSLDSRKVMCFFTDITERKEAQRRNKFLAILTSKLAGAITEADIIKITVEEVGTHLHVDRCYFTERQGQEDRLKTSHNWMRGDSISLEGEYDLHDYGGLEWWYQYSAGASSINDVSNKSFGVEDIKTNSFTQDKIANYDALGIAAYAVQPFRRDGEVAVCLAITESSPRKWTAYEMHILDDAVARVWPLVEYARKAKSLLESEEHFRALVTASFDAVYRMNPDWSKGIFLQGQDFIADIKNSSRTWHEEYIHPDDQDHVMEVVNKAIATKSNFELEYRIKRGDDSFGWVSSRAVPVFNAEGKIVEWFGAASDVTMRKQSEEKLRAAHDSFRHLVEYSPFGIYAVDADFRLVQVSAGAQKVFANVRPYIGRDLSEVLRIIWPEPFATEAITIFREVLKSGKTYHAPSTVEKRQDIEVEESYDWKVERIILPDGRPGAVCHFYDLTERLNYEARLLESEENFKALVRASSDVVYRMNADWSEMRPLDGRNFIKNSDGPSRTWFQDNIHFDDQTQVREVINEAIRTKSNFELEHRVRRSDDSFGWTFSRAVPVLNSDGEIIEWFGASSDINQRKELELQKEEFIGIAAHEIKTPVTTIKTFSELLQKKITGSAKVEYATILEHIITQSDRLTTLVGDLLSFSQMQAGKFLLNKEEFNLEKLIARTVSVMQETTPHHEIILKGSLKHLVLADAGRIEQVVINLLTNAIKYSPSGKKVIVSLQELSGNAFVSVQDFGMGIETKDLKTIFERFYRGKESNGFHKSEKAEGFGLGLFIAAQIIEKHGGKIEVKSVLHKGSTFTFTIPLQKMQS